MKKTKVISLIMAAIMLPSQRALASEVQSTEYDRFEALSNYAANLYIDDSVTADKIMTDALKTVINNNPELAEQRIKAGFQTLDPYTEYYTKEEYELFKKNLNHVVYGIGVTIQETDDGYVTVMSCMKGGGAESAGVQAGDKILRVNGVDAKDKGIEKVQDLILGELGTDVTVAFLRNGHEIECTITRKEVRGTTVEHTVLDDNIGYIHIVNFASDTADEFAEALADLDKYNVKNIILDLRSNPGGYLETAVDTAAQVVPEGVIVKTVYRNENSNKIFYSQLKETKYKFAVLVNENTASSAEVLASAMQDSGAGYIIGCTTYGKGVIQEMFESRGGAAFKITTGRYFTRNGNDINGNGIQPDDYVENHKRPIDITKYTTFDYKTKPSLGAVSQNVKAAKERLKVMGYYHGDVNESFDENFENSVKKFQEKNELFPYGVLDISTQVKMENIFYKLDIVVDNQFDAAFEYLGGKIQKTENE